MSCPDLIARLDAHAEARPDAPALVHPDVAWTWRELRAAVSSALTELSRHAPGERVPVSCGSALELVPKLLATQAAGVCLVPLDSHLGAEEQARRAERARAHRGPSGVLVFTSGTTAEPRAVRLPMSALLASAEAVIRALDLRAGEAWMSSLPLAHVGGIGVVLRCALAGATTVLDDRFDPDKDADALASHLVTHASFVPRMLDRVLQRLDRASPHLKAVMVGGGPSTPDLLRRARAAQIPVVTTWGLSEAGSTVTVHRAGSCPDDEGSAGWPLSGVFVRIADPGDDGAGPIEVSGPTLMEGYDDGEQLDGDWLRTGDIGRLLPDGRLVVLDRRRDLIVSGGENVAPSRVEAVVAEHPDLDEVAVVGVPEPSWGEQVVAGSRPRADREVSPDDVLAWAAERLTAAERPRRVVTWPEPLPRNPTGKLLRHRLRQAVIDLLPLLLVMLATGCAHNTVSRDAAALEQAGGVVYRAEAVIDASADVVFSVVADVDRYSEWNPWLVKAWGDPSPGERVDADLVLRGKPRKARHIVLEVAPHTRFCWRDRGWTTAFAYGQRCRTFEALPDGRTRFHVELLVSGPFTRTVVRQYGAELQDKLAEETAALATRAEALMSAGDASPPER